MENYKVVFVSGNTDINEKDFMNFYYPILSDLLQNQKNLYFVLSDDEGCAEITQLLIKTNLKEKKNVSIFGMGEDPKVYIDQDFVYVGGFKTLEERDAAMTMLSNMDLHIVLEGKGRSAVEHNILRRNEPKYDYDKFILSNTPFWSTIYKKEQTNDNLVV